MSEVTDAAVRSVSIVTKAAEVIQRFRKIYEAALRDAQCELRLLKPNEAVSNLQLELTKAAKVEHYDPSRKISEGDIDFEDCKPLESKAVVETLSQVIDQLNASDTFRRAESAAMVMKRAADVHLKNFDLAVAANARVSDELARILSPAKITCTLIAAVPRDQRAAIRALDGSDVHWCTEPYGLTLWVDDITIVNAKIAEKRLVVPCMADYIPIWNILQANPST